MVGAGPAARAVGLGPEAAPDVQRQERASLAVPRFKDGTLTFRLSYTGTGGVTIWLLDQNGVRQVLLARSATSTATQTADVVAGSYLLDIAGEGEWSLSLTQ